MEYLFSYGTLQQKNVQIENFGRILEGSKDVLPKYVVKELEITDEEVLRISNKKFHPILFFTNNENDEVHGTVFKITFTELLRADDYEVDDYERVKATLKSGINSWICVGKS